MQRGPGRTTLPGFRFRTVGVIVACVLAGLWAGRTGHAQEPGAPLPGTKPLTMTGDIASDLVAGADRFLLKQIDAAAGSRERYWKRDLSSVQAYEASVEPNRRRLAHILGVRDAAVPSGKRMYQTKLVENRGFPLPPGGDYWISSARWSAFGDVTGEGIELQPQRYEFFRFRTLAIVIPDADQTPEQLAGLEEGVPPESQLALRLAASGCHVIVPALIDRTVVARNGRAKLTSREFIYRSAFELGRHLIGYEVQRILGLIDCAERRKPDPPHQGGGFRVWRRGPDRAVCGGA